MDDSEIQKRVARIRLILMDCDGVLTDGRIWILENDDQKAFHTRDGLGIALWHRAGGKSGVISGRASTALERRARSLGMTFILLGCENKRRAFDETLSESGLSKFEVAFIGDDLNDIPPMSGSGFGVAVADAAAETRAKADYVTKARGGHGAVREVIELILKAQGRWNELVKAYSD